MRKMTKQWRTVILDTNSENDLDKLLVTFAKNRVSYEFISYDTEYGSIEIKIHKDITHDELVKYIKQSGTNITKIKMTQTPKSPTHVGLEKMIDMRVYLKYDDEKELQEKRKTLNDYCNSIGVWSDELRKFNGSSDLGKFSMIELLQDEVIGLKTLLLEWNNNKK